MRFVAVIWSDAAGMVLDPALAHVMICGSPAMVEDSMTRIEGGVYVKHRRRDGPYFWLEL